MVTKIGKTFKHCCLLTQHLWHYGVAALIRVGNFQPTPNSFFLLFYLPICGQKYVGNQRWKLWFIVKLGFTKLQTVI